MPMTMQQLSKYTVKIQLSPEEVQQFLPADLLQSNSPEILRLLSRMLAKAEQVCKMSFSEQPVTAELLHTPDGGMIVYFSMRVQSPATQKTEKALPIAVLFEGFAPLRDCCKQCVTQGTARPDSALYRYQSVWVLLVTIPASGRSSLLHLCMEYGRPIACTPLMRAKLAEYGICQIATNAIAKLGRVQT